MDIEEEAETEKVLTLSAVIRKQDMKILFVDCGDDFVELLFSFLALPLESVWEISGNNISLGCSANFCRSFKDMSGTKSPASECVLPRFYSFKVQLPGIITLQPPVYYRYKYSPYNKIYALTKDSNQLPHYCDDKVVPVTLLDPKSNGNNQSSHGGGFLKKETKFTVSDDLIITPMNSCSTVCLLKKLEINAEDLEVQETQQSGGCESFESFIGDILCFKHCLMWFNYREAKEETTLRNSTPKKPKEETCSNTRPMN